MNKSLMGACLRIALVLMIACVAGNVNAQYVRTTYFMDGSQYRLQLNPALAPSRGYIHLPAIGQTNASLYSNALGANDVVDLLKNADDADYYTTDKFMNRLVDRNKASVVAGTDLLSVGHWQGKNFISFNVGVRADGNIIVPRQLFSFMRDMKGMNSNDYSNYMADMSNEELYLNTYAEVGLGYTRMINDRVSIGGRLKGLVGLGNVQMKVGKAVVRTNLEGVDPNTDWTNAGFDELLDAQGTAQIDVDAELITSFKGLKLSTNSDGFIDDVELNVNKMGFSGYGGAIDLGVAVDVTEDITLSAAITDLGFICWTKGSTEVAYSNSDELSFNSEIPGDISRFIGVVGSGKALNWDMVRLTPDAAAAKSRTTMLASTLAVGGEYRLLDDKLSLGALFTNRFARPDNQAEVTLSVAAHPSTLLDFAVSYSPIMCGGASFGVAMKLGPLFLGTDYMYFGNNTKCCNAQVGLSIPLGTMD